MAIDLWPKGLGCLGWLACRRQEGVTVYGYRMWLVGYIRDIMGSGVDPTGRTYLISGRVGKIIEAGLPW